MKTKYSVCLLAILMLLAFLLTGCTSQGTVSASPIMKVHFIDVGQSDCIFLQLPEGKTLLIDGGNKADTAEVIKYLQQQNVKTIDYLIATHPHEDHIGSLPSVIKSFEIGSIYMPKVTANTRIFEDLLAAIKSKGLKINTAAAGVKIIDDKDTKLVIAAPSSSKYDELNNYSVVAKLTYKQTSFLFTGDAEDVSEREMLKNRQDIYADVVKVGHHGGRTSSTEEFLAKVSPKYAIITVGKDNDYGHPHAETLKRLKGLNTQIFRTDEQGTIIAASDGKTITINKSPSAVKENSSPTTGFYIGNKNSKVFHLPSCSSLPKPENQIKLSTKQEAQSSGYTPCSKCKP